MNFGAAVKREEGIIETEYEETGVTLAGNLDIALVRPRFEDFRKEALQIKEKAGALVVSDDDTLNEAVTIGGRAKKIAKMVNDQADAVTSDAREYIDAVRGIRDTIISSLIIIRNSKKEITNSGSVEQSMKDKILQHQSRVELERRELERKQKEAAAELQRKLDEEAAEANRKAAEEARKRVEEEQRIIREKQEVEAKARREREEAEAKERGAKEAELKSLQKKAEEERQAAAKKAEEERQAALQLAMEEAAKNAVIAPTVVAPTVPAEQKVVRTESGSSSYQSKAWKAEIFDPSRVPIQFCSPDQKKINEAVKAGIRDIPGVRITEETQTKFRA